MTKPVSQIVWIQLSGFYGFKSMQKKFCFIFVHILSYHLTKMEGNGIVFVLHKALKITINGLSIILFSLALCLTEVQEPYAVVVLLEKDLIVVDLTQSKYVFHIYEHIFQQLSSM